MGRGGWVAPGVFIDPTAGANKKAQLRPLFIILDSYNV